MRKKIVFLTLLLLLIPIGLNAVTFTQEDMVTSKIRAAYKKTIGGYNIHDLWQSHHKLNGITDAYCLDAGLHGPQSIDSNGNKYQDNYGEWETFYSDDCKTTHKCPYVYIYEQAQKKGYSYETTLTSLRFWATHISLIGSGFKTGNIKSYEAVWLGFENTVNAIDKNQYFNQKDYNGGWFYSNGDGGQLNNIISLYKETLAIYGPTSSTTAYNPITPGNIVIVNSIQNDDATTTIEFKINKVVYDKIKNVTFDGNEIPVNLVKCNGDAPTNKCNLKITVSTPKVTKDYELVINYEATKFTIYGYYNNGKMDTSKQRLLVPIKVNKKLSKVITLKSEPTCVTCDPVSDAVNMPANCDSNTTGNIIDQNKLCSLTRSCGENKPVYSNNYCKVYCTDNYTFNLMDRVTATAGRTFIYNISTSLSAVNATSASVFGQRTCASVIDYDKWVNDGGLQADLNSCNLVKESDGYKTVIEGYLQSEIEKNKCAVEINYEDKKTEVVTDFNVVYGGATVNYCKNCGYENYCGDPFSKTTCNNEITLTNTPQNLNDWNCANGKCANNNLVYITLEKEMQYYQNTEYYTEIYTGNLINAINQNTSSSKRYLLIGNYLYTVEADKLSGEYNMQVSYDCNGHTGTYTCPVKVVNTTKKYTCLEPPCEYDPADEIGSSDPEYINGRLGLAYRSVDLENMFPKGNTKSNWQNATDIINNIRDNASKEWESPQYKVVLTPGVIGKIKEHNATVSDYSDYSFINDDGTSQCDENLNCRSEFLDDLQTTWGATVEYNARVSKVDDIYNYQYGEGGEQ